MTKREWVSENSARLFLQTDVFQTWLFDFQLHPSMVLREHTPTDNYFEHTLPEDVPFGMHKATNNRVAEPSTVPFSFAGQDAQSFYNNYWAVFIMSEQAEYVTESTLPAINFTGGSANACYYYAMPITSAKQFAAKVNQNGQADAIVTAICVPKGCVVFHDVESSIDGLGYVTGIPGNTEWRMTVTKQKSTIDGYTPKNKKLFCYPYNFDMLYTGNQQQVLRYEFFNNMENDQYELNCYFMLSAIPIYGVMPRGYDGKLRNEQAGLQMQNLPPMAWTNDFFSNYLGLHAYSLAANTVIPMLNSVNTSQSDLYGAGSVAEQLIKFGAAMLDMKQIPRTEKGAIDGNYAVHTGTNHIYICTMQIRAEYARIVDEYFTMYGYRVNEMKSPQFNSRKRFNYLQTLNVDISGEGNIAIPQDDLAELADMFDKGITVWHINRGAEFGSYTGDNSPQ